MLEGDMCEACEKRISKIWPDIPKGSLYRTPDLHSGKAFSVGKKSPENIRIVPQNIIVTRSSFVAAIHYLFENRHYEKNPCEIRSSNSTKEAGPLCISSRDRNSNVRCINYILPILQSFLIVGIDSSQPNKTWLL
jgi:hypothetical protein